jgi:hypothetical protein
MSEGAPSPLPQLGAVGQVLPWLAVIGSLFSGQASKTSPADIERAVSQAVAPMRSDLRDVRAELRSLDRRATKLEAGKK